jgi:hypothetical protein
MYEYVDFHPRSLCESVRTRMLSVVSLRSRSLLDLKLLGRPSIHIGAGWMCGRVLHHVNPCVSDQMYVASTGTMIMKQPTIFLKKCQSVRLASYWIYLRTSYC